ncbi:PPOX class F420-dependent oxidoreductase [Nocardioides sp. CER19]|uniref:PPOX class F420-dependent oxidoreductase n=1 Tax=Nocardioides sp. CER19 TaxID=3038538 RepID=UPI0024490133|nr:PPOX class F420-dependent oxidoreductase [Nocardioides sp. CER19]MDH2416182.1 PPOX class F420-dependent oxidoreductase [Nocardioides sp. CER19]
MEISEALAAVARTHEGVLVTLKKDGLPQLSNVSHAVDAEGVIRVSTTATRAKTHNLRRTPWAALHVNGSSFWEYAVLECAVELSAVAADPADAAVEELIAVFRSIKGEHDDWDDYRRAMVADQRLVVRLRPTRAYGALR